MAYFEKTNLADSKGGTVNPAAEEHLILLRRMVKLMESNATVDISNRQRVTVDTITAGSTVALAAGAASIGTVLLGAGTNVIGSVNIGAADHRQFIDVARTSYNTGIRSKLTFT